MVTNASPQLKTSRVTCGVSPLVCLRSRPGNRLFIRDVHMAAVGVLGHHKSPLRGIRGTRRPGEFRCTSI
jgi:hypothetical protein